jgi:hypothetical protein
MNDLAKSLVAITLLAMLGGLAVTVVSRVIRVLPAAATPAVVECAPLHVRAPADSSTQGGTVRDSSSVKAAK